MTQRILIVDDEPGICHVLRSVLQGESYYVETALSAREALNKLAVAPFDLAIVDLYLPGVNGLQLAEAIRFLDPHTPVILMTAYGTQSFEVMACHPAITAYVHKPFDLDTMLALIRRTVLRQASGHKKSLT